MKLQSQFYVSVEPSGSHTCCPLQATLAKSASPIIELAEAHDFKKAIILIRFIVIFLSHALPTQGFS